MLKQIIKDSGRQVTSLKEMKKDVKKKMMEEKYDIFDEIYSNNNARMNKHIFFDWIIEFLICFFNFKFLILWTLINDISNAFYIFDQKAQNIKEPVKSRS